MIEEKNIDNIAEHFCRNKIRDKIVLDIDVFIKKGTSLIEEGEYIELESLAKQFGAGFRKDVKKLGLEEDEEKELVAHYDKLYKNLQKDINSW